MPQMRLVGMALDFPVCRGIKVPFSEPAAKMHAADRHQAQQQHYQPQAWQSGGSCDDDGQ